MRRAPALVLLIITLFCLPAAADQVRLKNGDQLSGKIIKSDTKALLLKTEFAGDVTIAWEAITEVTSETPLYVTLADGRTVSGPVKASGERIEVQATDGAVTASKADIRFFRSEGEQAAFVKLQHPGWRELWQGSADLGAALSTGNSETTNIAMGLAIARSTTRDKASFYGASLYARDRTGDESRTTANTIRGGFRYDRDISRKWFGYGFVDLEHNELQDLTLRLVLGGGLGYHAIRTEKAQLDLLGGLDWNKEYFSSDFEDRSSAEAQLGQTFAYKLNSRAALKEQLYYFPNLSEGGEYRLNFDTQLVADLTRRIGWQLTVSNRYLSNPPPDRKKNDLILTTGLSFKIGGIGK